MKTRMKGRWYGLMSVGLLAIGLAGCGGGDSGETTTENPPPVVQEPPVPVPTGTSPITLTANTSPQAFAALSPKVTVGKVTIANGAPVVDFSMTDVDGNAIIGFGTTAKSATATVASYPNLAFSLAKLVPGTNGSPSKWVSYIVTTVPVTTSSSTCAANAVCPTRPSTDNTGTLVDNRNGTYKYTFYRDVTKIKDQVAAMTVSAPNNKADLGDLTFEPNLVHRLTIQVSGAAPGTGTNTPNATAGAAAVQMQHPLDVIYDFVPATGKAVTASDPSRDIVATAKCEECHRVLGGIPGDNPESSAAGFHGGSRNNAKYCVVCHTDQRRYGRTEATLDAATLAFTSGTNVVDGRTIGNFPNYIHKIHAGGLLAKQNYNYADVKFNEIHYPQDLRNCTKCHDGSDTSTAKTAQGNNWMNNPSRLACGSCHDGINFETGRGVTIADAAKGLKTSQFGHVGGAQSDDSLCALCHKPATIDVAHLPVTPPNLQSALHVQGGNANTNAAWIASNTARLPAGALKVSYEIQSVSRDANKRPVMVFRILQNGQRKDLNNPATSTEIWDGFMGAPSVYFVFAVPQDGIAAPSDFNASTSSYLRSLWNGTAASAGAGTLTGPDANGFYTATLTGSTIPDNAVMLTGGVGYSYNVRTSLPLTQVNLPDYPVTASTVPVGTGGNELVAGMPNKVGGLIVVAPNVQKPATGYSPRRAIVEDARCNKCHQELGAFTEEAFHGGQRNDGTTCSWCHNPNRTSSGWSADSTSFVHAIHASAKRTVPFNWHAISPTETFDEIHYPGVLAQCEQCHLPGTYDFSVTANADAAQNKQYRTVATGTFATGAANAFTFSPYIQLDVPYGSGFGYNAATGVPTDAAPSTLVTSPTATVCFACHDSAEARAHIETVGNGSIYLQRSTALAKPEQCFTCHGSGRVADIKLMHNK